MASTRTFARHTGAIIAIAAAAVVGALVAAPLLALQDLTCVADFSEATIPAPESWRGRAVCGVTDSGELVGRLPWIILGAVTIALVLAVAVWVLRHRLRLLVPALLGQLVLPVAVGGALLLLPADCSDGALAEHGAPGCERDEEERPGISVRE